MKHSNQSSSKIEYHISWLTIFFMVRVLLIRTPRRSILIVEYAWRKHFKEHKLCCRISRPRNLGKNHAFGLPIQTRSSGFNKSNSTGL